MQFVLLAPESYSMLLAGFSVLTIEAALGYLCVGFGEPAGMNCICMGVLMSQEVEDTGMHCGTALWTREERYFSRDVESWEIEKIGVLQHLRRGECHFESRGRLGRVRDSGVL